MSSSEAQLASMWRNLYNQMRDLARQTLLDAFGGNVRGGKLDGAAIGGVGHLNPSTITPSATAGDVLTTIAGSPNTVGWLAGGAAGSPALSYASAALGADVTISSANSFYAGPSVALAAGKWLVTAHMTFKGNGTNGGVAAKLWDGSSTVYASVEGQSTYYMASVALSAIVVLTSTTTVRWDGTANNAGLTIMHVTGDFSGIANATMINAVKIG